MRARPVQVSLAAGAIVALWLGACAPEATKEKILAGDATVATSADLEALASYTAIEGRLTVKRAAIRRLSLPRLKAIGGKLYVQKNAELVTVALPALESIGSEDGDAAIIEKNPALVEVMLGALKTSAHQIAVRENEALERIDLGALTEIVGVGLDVADNPSLRELNASRLLVAASVSVTDCPRLERLAMPDLKAAAAIVLERDASLRSVDLQGFERLFVVPGSIVPGCRLSIVGSALGGLGGLRSLGSIGPDCEIDVRENRRLPACDVAAFLKTLAKAGWRGLPAVCGKLADSCGGERCTASGGAAVDAGP
jgi:hypothetical protein